MEKMMIVNPMGPITQVLESILEDLKNRIREEEEREIAELVESIPVDLEKIVDEMVTLEGYGIEVTREHYQEKFYNSWMRNAHPSVAQLIKRKLSVGSSRAEKFRDSILGMGSKLKTAVGGLLCVASAKDTSCGHCYFSQVCNCPKK